MFKCIGNCAACKKCYNIFPHQVEKHMDFPINFLDILKQSTKSYDNDNSDFGIAFDIGTTTIAAALWNLDTNQMIATIGSTNPQRNFGSDVISRIAYCQGSKEKRENLRIPLIKTLEKIVLELVLNNGLLLNQIKKCVFCGNTTMTLILADMSTDGLACFPFEPDKTLEIDFDFYVNDYKIYSVIMPGISGHIGGDITGAMLASEIYKTSNSLLLDLGTNGEIICNIDGKLYGFSTAAGPAFEGANISSGMPATVGAIKEFFIDENTCDYKVIANVDGVQSEKPLGICGTGLMSAIDNLLAQNILNVHGDLCSWDDYKRLHPYSIIGDRISDKKFIFVQKDITIDQKEIAIIQNDIRQLQMAKAAILAGINTLFKTISLDFSNIDTVYLAGGFSQISPKILNSLNIVPFDISDKLKCIGNAALAGASMVLLSHDLQEKAKSFADRVDRIELSTCQYFQEEFLNSFDFKKL